MLKLNFFYGFSRVLCPGKGAGEGKEGVLSLFYCPGEGKEIPQSPLSACCFPHFEKKKGRGNVSGNVKGKTQGDSKGQERQAGKDNRAANRQKKECRKKDTPCKKTDTPCRYADSRRRTA